MLSSISNCDSIGDAIANSSQALSSIPSSESTSIRLFIHDVDSNDEPEIFETMDAVNGHDLLISLFGEDTEFSLRYKDGHYLCLDKSLKDQGVHDGDDLYIIPIRDKKENAHIKIHYPSKNLQAELECTPNTSVYDVLNQFLCSNKFTKLFIRNVLKSNLVVIYPSKIVIKDLKKEIGEFISSDNPIELKLLSKEEFERECVSNISTNSTIHGDNSIQPPLNIIDGLDISRIPSSISSSPANPDNMPSNNHDGILPVQPAIHTNIRLITPPAHEIKSYSFFITYIPSAEVKKFILESLNKVVLTDAINNCIPFHEQKKYFLLNHHGNQTSIPEIIQNTSCYEHYLYILPYSAINIPCFNCEKVFNPSSQHTMDDILNNIVFDSSLTILLSVRNLNKKIFKQILSHAFSKDILTVYVKSTNQPECAIRFVKTSSGYSPKLISFTFPFKNTSLEGIGEIIEVIHENQLSSNVNIILNEKDFRENSNYITTTYSKLIMDLHFNPTVEFNGKHLGKNVEDDLPRNTVLNTSLTTHDFDQNREYLENMSKRTYDSHESILVQEVNPNGELINNAYNFSSLQIIYRNDKGGESSYESLSSALTDGFQNIPENSHFRFSGKTRKDEKYRDFLLPLLPIDSGYNTMTTIYRFVINGVKNHFVGVEKGDTIVSVLCPTDSLIIHSTQSFINVVISYENDKNYYHLYPYDSCRVTNEEVFIKHTMMTKKRDEVIADVIRYNIFTLIEGETSSGKTFTVEQYCRSAQLPLVRYNFSPSSTVEELIGDLTISNNADEIFIYKDGPFTDAFVHGKVLLLDEMSLSPPPVVQSLLSFLFGKKLLHHTNDGLREDPMHKDFRIIATQNPAGSDYKRSLLSSNIKDCFRVVTHDERERYFPRIDKAERLEIITGMIKDAKLSSEIAKIHNQAALRYSNFKRDVDKGKEYTLRDCTRTKAIFDHLQNFEKRNQKKFEERNLKHALQIVYYEQLDSKPIVKAPEIKFTGDRIDRRVWSNVYDRLKLGLDAGCHILLIGKTEYDARKYCHAFLDCEDFDASFIHCSSSSSTESIIGGYAITESLDGSDPHPQFVPGPFLTHVQNGGVCVFLSMDVMKSNVIERLNSVFELLPKDGREHWIRFDENRDNPLTKLNPDFLVIATTSEQGLQSFSPALRNRFLEIFIGEEKDEDLNQSLPPHIHPTHDSDFNLAIMDYEGDLNFFEKQSLLQCLLFINHQTNIEINASLIDLLVKKTSYPTLYQIGKTRPSKSVNTDLLSSLFYSICQNKATLLYGPRASGKTYFRAQLINEIGIEYYYVISVSEETEYNTLMGSVDIKGHFNSGLLMECVEKGYLVVFENAENMSAELREQLDNILDPFSTEFVYSGATRHSIHPSFRALFLYTTKRNMLPFTPPKYYSLLEMPVMNSTIAKQFVMDPFCCILCNHLDKGDISIHTISLLEKIRAIDPSKLPILMTSILFADNDKKKEMMKNILQNECSSMNSEDVQSALAILESNVSISSSDERTILLRGCDRILYNSTLSLANLEKLDSSIYTALFTANLSMYSTIRLPLLLIGDPDVTSEVAKILAPNAYSLELSGAMELSHVFGDISVCREEDIEYILQTIQLNGDINAPIQQYRHYLNQNIEQLQRMKAEGCTNPSVIMYRPGPLLTNIMANKPIILNNINLVNDHLRPRLYSLMFNLDKSNHYDDEFTLFEDTFYNNHKLIGSDVTVIATCEPEDISRVENLNDFIPIFCQNLSPHIRSQYHFGNVEKYPLHILKKAQLVKDAFINPFDHALFYLRFLQSDESKRRELLDNSYDDEKLKIVVDFLDRDETDVNDMDIDSRIPFLTGEIQQKIKSSLNPGQDSLRKLLPTQTTIQLLASIAIADQGHIPLILEGDPGVGKTIATQNYCLAHGIHCERVSFSNNTTIDSIFGCYTIVDNHLQFKDGKITEVLKKNIHSGKRIALLLDEVNLAPCDVLEVILSLIRAYCNHQEFQIPGSDLITIPTDMLIVCCMNPASMSANRSSLPRQFFSHCIYHRKISYTIGELLRTSGDILKLIPSYTDSMDNIIAKLFHENFQSSRKTSIPFSLRDVLKVKQICDTKNTQIKLEEALWLVFACRHKGEERIQIEKILGQEKISKVQFKRQGEQYEVTAFWSLTIPEKYDCSFNEFCFTTTECFTVFKLCLALLSKRAIIMYGPSPSGKSFVISETAKMWGRKCRTVYLNHESTPDAFIGHYSLVMDKDTKKNKTMLIYGPLLEAMRSGDWIVIEDIHLANNDVMESLNPLCEEIPSLRVFDGEKEVLFIPEGSNYKEEGIEIVYINPSFRIFFTISDHSLKHFTGPFLSRCLIIYSDPISDARSVQEICDNVRVTGKPQWFGEKEANEFRKCMRIINSGDQNSFNIEFGYTPNDDISNLLIDTNRKHTLNTDIQEVIQRIQESGEKETADLVRKLLLRLCDEVPLSFNREEVCESLGTIMSCTQHSFYYYIAFIMRKLLSGDSFDNIIIRKQNDSKGYSRILSRWYILNDINPKLQKNERAIKLTDEYGKFFDRIFDIPLSEQYQLYLLYYICDRVSMLAGSMEENDLELLCTSLFSYMDTLNSQVDIINLVKSFVIIRQNYLEARNNAEKYERMANLDMLSKVRNIETVIKGELEQLPTSIQECPGMKKIIEFVSQLVERVKEMTIKKTGFDDQQGLLFDDAMHYSKDNSRLQDYLKKAFSNNKMTRKTFDSLRLNDLDKDYKTYEYKRSDQMMIAKTSHMLLKLEKFNCHSRILVEYSDVLMELELDIMNVLNKFENYGKVKESLVVLLNAFLLKQFNKYGNWEEIVRYYHMYPFKLPTYQDEHSIDEAIGNLVENDWYDDKVKRIKDDEGFKKRQAEDYFAQQVAANLKSSSKLRQINLRSMECLEILDSGDEGRLRELECDVIYLAQPHWKLGMKCPGGGDIIPLGIMRCEGELVCPSYIKEKELFERIWSRECKLSVPEKIEIISPRKRGSLGNAIIDIYNHPKLQKPLLESLSTAETIDDLIECIKRRYYGDLDNIIKEKRRLLTVERKKCDQLDSELKRQIANLDNRRKQLIQKYDELAEDKNLKEFGMKSDEFMRNTRSIHVMLYLQAINQLSIRSLPNYCSSYWHDESYWLKSMKSIRDKITDYFPSQKEGYKPFSFQVIVVDKEMDGDILFSLHPPEGMMNIPSIRDFELSNGHIKKNGYFIVLPLAPWKWDVEFQREYDGVEIKYFPCKVSGWPYLSFNLKNEEMVEYILFKRMIDFRDYTKFQYEVDDYDYSQLENYAKNSRYTGKGIALYICKDGVELFKSKNAIPLECYHYDDDASFEKLNYISSSNVYTRDSFVRHLEKEGQNLSWINYIASEDVNQYNRLLNGISRKRWDINNLQFKIDRMKKEVDELEDKLSLTMQYFLPPSYYPMVTGNAEIHLSDVLLILRDKQGVSVCTPNNSCFVLPVHYIGYHERMICIPIVTNDKSLNVVVKNENEMVDVSVDKKQLIIMLNNPTEGEYKLDVNLFVTDENGAKLTDEKTISFKLSLKNMPYYIETSEECICKDNALYIDSYSITARFCDEEVGKKYKTGGLLRSKSKQVWLNYNKYNTRGFKSKIFIWETSNSLKAFIIKDAEPNYIEFEGVDVDISSALTRLKSSKLSEFLLALDQLIPVIMMASDDVNRDILSLLNGCINSSSLLPSIKEKVRVIFNIVQSKPTLRWNRQTTSKLQQIEEVVTDNVEEDEEKQANDECMVNGLILEEGKSTSGKTTYGVTSHNMKTQLAEVAKALVINHGLNKKRKEAEKKQKENKEKKEVEEKEEEYHPINYANLLKMMEEKTMDELYLIAECRCGDGEMVTPGINKQKPLTHQPIKTTKREGEKCNLNKIKGYIKPIVSDLLTGLLKEFHDFLPSSNVNIIIDVNCTHRHGKERIRSLLASILVVMLKEMNIPFSLYVACARARGALIPTENVPIDDIIQCIFDLEVVKKMPSTPLDILEVPGHFDIEDPVVIISDGISEQLISPLPAVKDVFNNRPNKLFLMQIIGVNKTALSPANQEKLNNQLTDNFGDCIIPVDNIDEISKYISVFARLLFTGYHLECSSGLKPYTVDHIPNSYPCDISNKKFGNITRTFQDDIYNPTTIQVELVDVTDEELAVNPVSEVEPKMLGEISTEISPDCLFDSMNSTLFVPNKSTGYIASTTGNSIHIANYIKYYLTKAGDGKLFKKLGSDKVRSYCASIVIDCSSLAFGYVNRTHSLVTILTILRNISNMQLPCVDIWVADNEIKRICTGVMSNDLWEPSIILRLLGALEKPCYNTSLAECINYAIATGSCRSFSTILLVLTNGVLSVKTREYINSVASVNELVSIGIGIGNYLNGFENLFPTMLWAANPTQLSQAIMNISMPEKPLKKYNGMARCEITDEIMTEKYSGYYDEMIKNIINIPSFYQAICMKQRFLDTTGSGLISDDEYKSSQHDLGIDGEFGDYSILFIILYLCRGVVKNNKIEDEYITWEVLRYGRELTDKEIKEEKHMFSPILKLGQEKTMKYEGKGFNIDYAFDYETAITKLCSGQFRMAFITCSPGDGIFPERGEKGKQDYCDSFLECVHSFHEAGGGIFWFLENFPFTYEADEYFKKYYGYPSVDPRYFEKNFNIKSLDIDGRKEMVKHDGDNPQAGTFRTIGGNMNDISKLSQLDLGIRRIYEGATLCRMNEKALLENGFSVFARESEGNAAIVVHEIDENCPGRMIIDTAASKLFLEFESEGTARWISNAAVWLCNTDRYNREKQFNDELKTGIQPTFTIGDVKSAPFIKRESKSSNFAITIIMDTTGSMGDAIAGAKNTVLTLLSNLQKEKAEKKVSGKIIGQVIQYKDFGERGNSNYCNMGCLVEDFNILRQRLAGFKPTGGGGGGSGCTGWCEDMQYGFEVALNNIEKLDEKYFHFIVVIGDYPNHGDENRCGCTHRNIHPYHRISYDDVWKAICQRIKKLENYKVCVIPVGNIQSGYNSIRSTFDRLHKPVHLGNKIECTSQITANELSNILINETVSAYRNSIS